MTQHPAAVVTRAAIRTPRAAAVAGIVFAVLLTTTLLLLRWALPNDTETAGDWLDDGGRRDAVVLALNLLPFAGLAFLWFIGVIRDRIGAGEDRFFATVFLGSGLLFLALTFVGAALAGGLLASYTAEGNIVGSGVLAYGRAVMFQVINVYAIRMAGVFMISLSTIWLRTGLMHRGWAFVTYALALTLLVSITISLWVTLIFPGWVLAVSVYFLIQTSRHEPKGATVVVDSA